MDLPISTFMVQAANGILPTACIDVKAISDHLRSILAASSEYPVTQSYLSTSRISAQTLCTRQSQGFVL